MNDAPHTDSKIAALIARANTGIRALSPYQPGKPIEELQRELGLTDIIKLASNENPLGPGARARAAMLARVDELARYPDGSGFQLKAALAAYHDCPSDWVTLGNGSNEVLEFIARVFAGPGDEVVFAEHCFTVYPLVTRAIGATPVEVPAKDFGHDLDAMARAVTAKTRLVFIANPNNPTGTWVDESALRALLQQVPADCVVVLDEAYLEYARRPGYPDGATLLADYPNLVVTRTFSKVHGLAALRIGYALSHAPVADLMNRVRQPFNVNDPSMAAAIAALSDDQHISASVVANNHGMTQLARGFDALGLSYIPSAANFLTFDTGSSGEVVFAALLRLGVIVRPVTGYGLPAHLRVTVGTSAENARFLAALAQVLRERNA
jgi:histidinol-phosphate aminotransferase